MGLFDKIKEFVAGEEESPVTAASVLAKVREKYPHLRGIDDLSLSQSLYKKDPAKFSYLKTYAPDTTVPPALVPKSMRDDAFYKANPQEGTKDALKVIEQVKSKFPKYKGVDAKRLAVALETKNPTMFAGLSKKLMPGQTAIPKGETEAATIPLIPSGTMGATKPVSPVQVTPPVRPIETKPEPKVRPSVTSISPEEAKLPDGTKPLKFKNGIEAYLAVEKLAKPTLVEYPGRHGQTIRRIMTTEIPSFPPPPEDKGKDLVGKIVGKEEAFARGVGVSGVQIPELAYGATALVADSAERLFGSGTASRVKDWALRGYQRASKVSEEVHGDEVKSVVESWKEAKKGNLDALGDWLSYWSGYGAGQLGESAAVAFLGGLVGSVVPGPGTAAGAVAGVTAKTATKGVIRGALERLVERQALKLTAEGVAAAEAKRLAVKQIATAIGAASAIGAYAVVQEGGIIYPDAVKKAEEDGRKLNGYDLGRVWGTIFVAAGADGLGDMLGLGFLTGKVRIPGQLGKVARIVGTAVSGGLAGGGTESIQTAVERVGAGRKPFDQAGIQDIIESAAAGAIPGLGAGGVGAIISGQPSANVPSLAATQEASPELLSYLDRVEKINRAQASDVTESQQKEDVTKGPARAEFIGYQEGLPEDTPIPLYNVMGESPRALSTVGSEELKSLGIETPKTPSFEEWKAAGDVTEGQVSAKKLIEKLASANEISDAVAVEFVKHITPTGENFYKSYGEEFSPEKFRVLGATIPQYTQNGLNFAIKLAQGAKESTGAHEMFHAMKQMGFFSQDEMRVLEGRFGNEEKIADALGEYATRRTGAEAQSRIKAIFDRFLEFVKRVGSMLVGRGWTRAEDIFESVVKGRPLERAGGAKESTRFSAKAQEPIFYSQLQRTIEAKMPNSAPVEQVKGIIGGGAVKQDEIDWSGVNDFLEGKKTVTKAELLDFLKGNQVQVKEVVRGQREPLTEAEKDEQIRLGLKGHLTPREKMRYDDLSAKELGKATKFASYQLPGGENYREVLLTLPQRVNKDEVAGWEVWKEGKKLAGPFVTKEDGEHWGRSNGLNPNTDFTVSAINERGGFAKSSIEPGFRSSHFDEPNILAHVRMNDRTTADGKKVLFIEEVQSDWMQQGREKGFRPNNPPAQITELPKDYEIEVIKKNGKWWSRIPRITDQWLAIERIQADSIQKAIEAALVSINYPAKKAFEEGVPNAPFKKTWHELALKRMLRYAVDNGYDAIAWTTGEQQVKRYPEALRQVADHIEWDSTSDGKGVSIYKNGARILEADVAKDGTLTRATVDKAQGKHLSEVIGKTMAQKVIDSTHGKIKGEEFTVGGEGMKGFYDQIIPSFLNKYTKKWGGRVGETKINIGPSEESRTALQAAERTGDSALIADALGKGKDRMETVHSLDITPSMRESLSQGQPMFKAERIGDIHESVYAENRRFKGSRSVVSKTGEFLTSAKDQAETLLTPISSVLADISPMLRVALRREAFREGLNRHNDTKAIIPFLEAANKMRRDDAADLDLALKNGDSAKINQVIQSYGLEAEYAKVRKTLDAIHARAKEVGYDVGYLEEYWPRVIKDQAGFLKEIQADKKWPDIEKLIKTKEEELTRPLSEDEKVELINSYLRGYQNAAIALARTPNMKTRDIEVIGPGLNQHFRRFDDAVLKYVESMNHAIEAKRFFGRGGKDFFIDELDKSIGGYVLDMKSQGLLKDARDEKRLRDILQAYFRPESMHGAMAAYKNATVSMTIGNAVAALTQLQDIGTSIYRAPVESVGALARAAVGGSKITLEDIGIDQIGEELRDQRKSAMFTSRVLRLAGLGQLDKITAETFINSVIRKYQKQARKPSAEFMDRIRNLVGPDTAKAIEDLKSGEITDLVKFIAFSEILGVQPKAMTELPRAYLSGGNARIFYALKTFQLRQIDMFRQEIFKKMAEPGLKNKIIGTRRLIALSSALLLAGVGTDELKDFILGRTTTLSDRIVDNILKLVGLSKWTLYKARQEGIASAAIKTILPPVPLVDQLWKDIRTAGDKKGLEVVQSIPLVGKFYYWWMGKGRFKKPLNDDMRWLKENAGRLGLTRSKAYQYLNRTSTRSLLAETEKERTEARAKVESYAKRLRAMAESREAELAAREERRKARLAARR